MARVLAILTDGFEEIEAVAPIDLLRRAGIEVRIAALTPPRENGSAPLTLTGRCGMVLQAECTLDEALAAESEAAGTSGTGGLYDCVLLPGGPGVKALRASAAVREVIRQHHAAGRLVAAICAAPLVLLDAGILGKRRYTAHASVTDELPQIVAGEAVVVDEGAGAATGQSSRGGGGPLVTSRGAGTALDFGLTLVEILTDKATELRISTEIHLVV